MVCTARDAASDVTQHKANTGNKVRVSDKLFFLCAVGFKHFFKPERAALVITRNLRQEAQLLL